MRPCARSASQGLGGRHVRSGHRGITQCAICGTYDARVLSRSCVRMIVCPCGCLFGCGRDIRHVLLHAVRHAGPPSVDGQQRQAARENNSARSTIALLLCAAVRWGSGCLRGQRVWRHVGGGCPRPWWEVVQLGLLCLLKALPSSPLLLALLDGVDAAAYSTLLFLNVGLV